MAGIKEIIKKIPYSREAYHFLADNYMDLCANYYLRKLSRKKKAKQGTVMKVAFFVLMPATWDKSEPVYKELLKIENVDIDVILITGSDSRRLDNSFSKEIDFFNKHCKKLKVVSSDNVEIEMKNEHYDYVFYPVPYSSLIPEKLQAKEIIKCSKICYIPYATTDSLDWYDDAINSDFFRNVYFGFLEHTEAYNYACNKYKKNVQKGIQHFEDLGYPVFGEYLGKDSNYCHRVLWTPRWLYDPKVGGSHFMEYKDNVLALKAGFPTIQLTVRPHPLLFANMIETKRMTKEEVDEYKKNLREKNITLDEAGEPIDTLLSTDILIADFSSINLMYFMTGRPIIYCANDLNLDKTCGKIMSSCYVANKWDDVIKYLKELVNGNDYMKQQRLVLIDELKVDKFSAKRIVKRIVTDFYD